MPEVLDPGQGENRMDKFKEKPPQPAADVVVTSEEIGWREGVSPAARLQYWAYLGRWKKGGEVGRFWTLADIACAHRCLDTALRLGEDEKAAGYRRFLLMEPETEVTPTG